ncbi:uncharacterized protein LOC130944155 isoform X3 [Arachis stenosperma]|uniref:uncharacterized protein LOC130944155 isoform X3 n=1 Tax=Arachis stenosperma TaxID=217475 RepID=UPI0025AD6E16|nr:uncharacterized protein LOC130944155 isoform X3 [Arachis stenosperma]XP_057728347.1 uncharacterized protein LOC130944155 isoform X3 [Arachis stenosperma]
MLLSNSRCMLLNLYTFSPATFFKHLTPNNKPTTLCHRKTTVKSLATLSHFRTLSSRQRHQIHLYVHAILQWNKRMNLTAVKDADEVMERHVEDSLAILPPLKDCYRTRCGGAPSHEKLSLVDVGTGAGLPGVVLAIACPEWEVTLMESMNKRCVFLEHVVGIIGSSNIQIVRGRAELSIVFHWFVLVDCLLLPRVMTLRMKLRKLKVPSRRWVLLYCKCAQLILEVHMVNGLLSYAQRIVPLR